VDAIAILDFGSQTSQLIARRVREGNVYCELFPYDADEASVAALHPKGFILSGGPDSVYDPGAPQIPTYTLESGLPILGICYGMQTLTHALGGRVAPAARREYGRTQIEWTRENPLTPKGNQIVWMSHGDHIEQLPEGFQAIARSDNAPIAAMSDSVGKRFGLQFHPEVQHTQQGKDILHAFSVGVCGARPEWTADSIVSSSVASIREQTGSGKVVAAVSGGVDSTVAAALVHQALGDQLTCIFVDTGLLRKGEVAAVVNVLEKHIGAHLVVVDEAEMFLRALRDTIDPEEKRKIIGETFIRVFEDHARRIGDARFLVQGTIYPDVVESSAPDRPAAAHIKTHHNVGGLPDDLGLELIEPLRYLFKDEVRAVGAALGLPENVIWRQPFPGPGLAVRCLGSLNHDRLETLRAADDILLQELGKADMLVKQTSQAFAVLLPVRSVGVMGDQRTYGETVAVRAVTTDDFMTADWARLPHDLLAAISSRIVNEVPGVNRVVYDISTKPPATIEWE
jgi:GMP synthase (glutamine-hydrolysing)